MIDISNELRKMMENDGNLQRFQRELDQSGGAVIIALESVVKKIILDEKKISELEKEVKNLKAQYNCLEQRFQEKFPY